MHLSTSCDNAARKQRAAETCDQVIHIILEKNKYTQVFSGVFTFVNLSVTVSIYTIFENDAIL